MGFVQEFKEFAVKGNVVDMAVGIVIGAGFGKIVTSLVDNIIMPPVGLLLGGMDFSRFQWVLKQAVGETPEVAVKYGLFIQTVLDFLIVALAIFLVVKAMNAWRREADPDVPEPVEPPPQERLLAEIRDLLKAER